MGAMAAIVLLTRLAGATFPLFTPRHFDPRFTTKLAQVSQLQLACQSLVLAGLTAAVKAAAAAAAQG